MKTTDTQTAALKRAEEKLHAQLSETFYKIFEWEEKGFTQEDADRIIDDAQPRKNAMLIAGDREGFLKLAEETAEAMTAHLAYQHYDALMESLNRLLNGEYIHVPTQYILTSDHDAQLLSPVGFTADDRIWVKPSGMIYMTNRLPSAGNMVYWDVTKNMTGVEA